MVDVAPFGGHHAAGRLTHPIAESQRHGEDVGAEPPEVFVGQHVAGHRLEDASGARTRCR